MKSLRKLRLEKGIHLEHVWKDTGITIASLSHIERGDQTPAEITRQRLESYFDERINWLESTKTNYEPEEPAPT